MINTTQTKNEFVISYLLLRRLIGVLGILLPVVLPLGTWLLKHAHWLQPSISHYYYSDMHFMFVGVLFLLGGFLVCYEGKHGEGTLATFAGLFALGVAICPTNHEGFLGTQYIELSTWKYWFNVIHYGSALALFVCFAIFCFKIFQQSDDDTMKVKETFDDKKIRRNSFYRTCGYIIAISISCIGVISLYEWLVGPVSFSTYTTFIFETTSLWAFGSSWLLKGTYNMQQSFVQKMISGFR